MKSKKISCFANLAKVALFKFILPHYARRVKRAYIGQDTHEPKCTQIYTRAEVHFWPKCFNNT